MRQKQGARPLTRAHAPCGEEAMRHAPERVMRTPRQLRPLTAQEPSAYELWIKLEEMYQSKTSQNKALLMRRLVNLTLQRDTTMAEHTSEFQNLINQLTSVDLQFDNEMQALLLLSSLPESWETLEEHIKRDCPKYKAHDQSSEAATITVMAVDESNVLLAHARDVYGWRITQLAGLLANDQSSSAWETRVVCTREEKWSHDNSQSDVLCGTPWWGMWHTLVGVARHLDEKSYGGARSEAVRKDNLKTSDYPPVGWRGRLLSPAHLDLFKPTWMSPSPVAKPKPNWSSYGVSM
ncbi:hypothetical protein Acr_01g0008860 [Actinidia rufa]|uniref:Uncharacterized protein n=1 Tax=Actinidia rufa TaxID=165716 RepID=A0A7J0E5X9_9ERIC|nr:hypothetical protein Acr_01g0008860 [Actinidia rufa]